MMMPQAYPLPRAGWFAAACCTAVACSASGAWGAEDGNLSQLRLGVSGPPPPSVEEKVSGVNGGVDTTYTWQGSDHTAIQVSLEYLRVSTGAWGGPVYGLAATATRYNLTPTGYTVGNTTFQNDDPSHLGSSSIGGQLLGGWQFGATRESGTSAFAEILPFVGGGLAWAQTRNRANPSSPYETNRGRGWYGEYGFRLGAFIAERSWFAGVTSAYTVGNALVRIDTVGGGTSELRLERRGWGWGVVLGHNF